MKYLYLVSLSFFLAVYPSHSQVFKKIKEKIEKKANQVIEKLADKTFDSNDTLSHENSDSSRIEASNKVANGTSVTLAFDLNNQFQNKTEFVSYGEIVNQSPKFEISPCGDHAAILGLKGSRQTVFIDGQAGELFDEVFFGTFLFSPKGGHYAYVASKKGICMVVYDGSVIDTLICNQNALKYARARKQHFFEFSESGATLVYFKNKIHEKPSHEGTIANISRYDVVVINGVEGPPVRIFQTDYQRSIKVRGEKVFYITESSLHLPEKHQNEGDGDQIFINNKRVAGFSDADKLIVSNDGKKYVFVATTQDERKTVVINGEPHGNYNSVTDLEMDPETGTVFYIAYDDIHLNERIMNIGDKKYKLSETGRPSPSVIVRLAARYHFQTSPDGKHHAFISEKSGMGGRADKRVWIDGKPSLFYENISEFTFSRDSKHTMFIASNGGQSFVVIDGTELGPFDRADNLQISNKGNTYAFWAKNSKGMLWYVNGKPVEGFTVRDNDEFVFSHDGSRYAFIALNSNRENVVVVDGKERQQVLRKFYPKHNPRLTKSDQYLKFPPFIFSKVNNRLVYNTSQGLVIDNKLVEPANQNDHSTYPFFSPDGNHFAYLYEEKRSGEPSLWRLIIDGKPGPVVAEYFSSNPNAIKFLDNNTVQTLGFLDNEILKYTVSLSN